MCLPLLPLNGVHWVDRLLGYTLCSVQCLQGSQLHSGTQTTRMGQQGICKMRISENLESNEFNQGLYLRQTLN